jgi:alanine racemase
VSRFTLSAGALQNNLELAREWAPNGARVRAMVKANAYGHGLEELIAVFAEHADELGVATLEEGLALRSFLPREMPVYLVSGTKEWGSREYLESVRRARLIPAISSVDEMRLLVDRLGDGNALEIELKLDTGMGRLGIQERELDDLDAALRSSGGIRVVGIMTHYASSDEEDLAPTRAQDACFQRMLAGLPENATRGASVHSCNSGALMQRCLGETEIARGTSVVRPGVMLYGAGPSRWLHDTLAGERLKPVGRWTTRVIELRTMEPGAAVGYGGTWRVEGERSVQVAVLAVGYADGYRRILGNRSRVLIRGGSFPVIGRISMDLVSVLVDERIQVGDEAVLLGSQEGELGIDSIPAWEWADLCDTIPYEIWTSIGARVERVLAAD